MSTRLRRFRVDDSYTIHINRNLGRLRFYADADSFAYNPALDYFDIDQDGKVIVTVELNQGKFVSSLVYPEMDFVLRNRFLDWVKKGYKFSFRRPDLVRGVIDLVVFQDTESIPPRAHAQVTVPLATIHCRTRSTSTPEHP